MAGNKYLLVKAKGGMGNRMLCAVTGLLYGELTGRRTIVDWRDASYSEDGSNAFGRFFVNDSVHPESNLPGDACVRPSIWKGNLDKSMVQMVNEYDPGKHQSILLHRKYSIDVRRLDYEEDVLVFWNYLHCVHRLLRHLRERNHRFANRTVEQTIALAVKDYLRPSAAILAKVNQFKAAHWSHEMIGVHVRYTDRKIPLRKYERPLARLLSQMPDARIFLATDSQFVFDDYRAKFPNMCSTPKWFPGEAGSMHQNPNCPDKVANGIDALTDMLLLSECDCLIYPRCSTFSWLASLLSNAPKRRLIDVDRFDLKVRSKQIIWRLLT